jgi:hypothetical protein
MFGDQKKSVLSLACFNVVTPSLMLGRSASNTRVHTAGFPAAQGLKSMTTPRKAFGQLYYQFAVSFVSDLVHAPT